MTEANAIQHRAASRFDCQRAGYRMPAEWERQAATWLGWPVFVERQELWGQHYPAVCREFALVARTIARYQRCIVLAHWACLPQARELCGPGVEVVGAEAEDNWLRDFGPTFLTGAEGLAAAVFRFNAWGEKYAPYEGCVRAATHAANLADARPFHSEMVLEGGAIYVDGKGTLLTTESCLLDPSRNPGWSRREMEAELQRMLGVRKVIWLPGNPLETETNGHIDGIATFIGEGKVLVQNPLPGHDEAGRIYRENYRALRLATDAQGRSLELLGLPDPQVSERYGSDRYCDCYINYILVNGAVIAPAFATAQDAAARDALQLAFPDRAIEMLPIPHISIGGGSLHCSTQQQPAMPSALHGP